MSESDPNEAGKRAAARAAAAFVQDGMTVGLGSGSTAAHVVRELGRRVVEEALRIEGVSTSEATTTLAQACSIALIELDRVPMLDIVIDGADEIDGRFAMIKGRGGALLREKIVATASSRRIIAVTPEKCVEQLGRSAPVPVEVSPFGLRQIENALRNLGATTTVRRQANGKPVRTDEGHTIIDCRFLAIADPEELNMRLNGLPGVFETGLFVGLCDVLVVGRPDGADIFDRPIGDPGST